MAGATRHWKTLEEARKDSWLKPSGQVILYTVFYHLCGQVSYDSLYILHLIYFGTWAGYQFIASQLQIYIFLSCIFRAKQNPINTPPLLAETMLGFVRGESQRDTGRNSTERGFFSQFWGDFFPFLWDGSQWHAGVQGCSLSNQFL